MRKILKIEGIPNPGAKIYSFIARKSPFFRDLYQEVAEEVCTKISSGRILDVGTGPGYLPLKIARKSQSVEIIGLDISPAMVKIARQNAVKIGVLERVKFQTGDAANLPFENQYFDLVLSTLSLHHWSSPADCLKEIHRVLKETGEAWIYDIRRDTTRKAENELKNRYGRILSFFFLNVVRAHSSVTQKAVEELLSYPEIRFSKKQIEDKGVLLKLRLLRSSFS